jgi:hypothetical protein
VFQTFLISLSVLPGRHAAIFDHLYNSSNAIVSSLKKRQLIELQPGPCNYNVLVAERVVQLDESLLLLGGEVAALEVRAEVVDPPEPAALPAPEQACQNNSQISAEFFLCKICMRQYRSSH